MRNNAVRATVFVAFVLVFVQGIRHIQQTPVQVNESVVEGEACPVHGLVATADHVNVHVPSWSPTDDSRGEK